MCKQVRGQKPDAVKIGIANSLELIFILHLLNL